MPPLTRAQAEARSRRLQVRRVAIDLDVRDPDSFRSTTTIDFTDRHPGQQTFVDFRPETLLRAELNGVAFDPEGLHGNRLFFTPTAVDNTLVLSGDMAYANDGEGLHRHVDPADDKRYLYAMSFLDAGPRWFVSFDQPDLKAPYTMRVLTPPEWTVLGNGRCTEVRSGEWEMVETPPLASYFVTVVAGPYASVIEEYDGIRLGLHARASLAAELSTEADDILRVTKQGFAAFPELFAERYAFGDYHQAFVPDFNAGAMENPGCVTFRDTFLFRGAATRAERAARAGTVIHELAHQWFGDLVTMRWWDDLWLNESFAEYLAQEICTTHTDYPLWVDFGLNRKDWGVIADLGPNTHPVAATGAGDTQAALAQFDGISYAKGAGVLKQLVAATGVEVFRAGLRDFIARHRFGNAEFADLLAALERAGARDLDDWAQAWLRTAGMDLVIATEGHGTAVAPPAEGASRGGDHAAEGAPPRSAQVRRTPGGEPARRAHTLTIATLADDGTELGRARLEISAASEVVLPAGFVLPDVADETWARVRPSRPVADWPPVSAVADPLARVVLWNSIRDQMRSAELDPKVALETVRAELPDEGEDLIARAILDWAQTVAAGPFTRPDQRQERLCWIADTASDILAKSQPGTDLQLSMWRALMGCTDDADALAGWLAGEGLPDGRVLDADLRWAVTTRLVSLNGDRGLIEQAYATDRSTAGRVHRARALAALPDPEAKAAAFTALMSPGELSAYELYATAEGFFLPHQGEVTDAFVEKFFRHINHTANFRSGWALGQVVSRAFPVTANNRRTLELAQDLLASVDLAPGVRRPLAEATDILRRAVTSVEKYAPLD